MKVDAGVGTRREVLLWGLRGLAAGMLPGCCPCQQSDRAWNNALGLSGVDPDHQSVPTSLTELVQVVQRAEREGAGVRMTGSGHSFSDVAFSEDYLLSSESLQRDLPLAVETLRPGVDPDLLLRVEGGIRLRELNQRLAQRKLALSNLGGYDGQSIVGAAMTGTHGSGLHHGPIASQIASIELVGTGGQVLKVEPTNGITDPARFPGAVSTPEGLVPAVLVANDEVFNALAVSMGCMGVVYAVVLRVEPQFWLAEVRTMTTWGELSQPNGFLQRLLRGEDLDPGGARQPEHYEIYFNPYPPRPGGAAASHVCLLTRRYKTYDEPGPPTPDERTRGRYGSSALLAAAQITGYGARLVEYMNEWPRHVPNVLRDSLRALADRTYVDLSFNVFNLGPANLIRAYGIEMAFDLSQTVSATERVFAIASELATKGWLHNSPPSLRFVKRSACQLAMMHGRDTMMLEMGMLACANGADELLETYERRLMEEFSARPHWGLDLNVLDDFAQVRALYPESADSWRSVYECLNRRGTFNAPFTDRLGISLDSDDAASHGARCAALGIPPG